MSALASTVVLGLWCVVGQAGPPAPELTDAERIARLQRSVEVNQKELQSKQAELQNPEGSFQRADASFKKLDAQREDLQKEIQRLQKEGKTAEAARKFEEANELQARWKLSRERFDLAIQERQLLQQKIATLQKAIQEDQQALDRLLNGGKKTGEASEPPPAPAADARKPNRKKAAVPAPADPPSSPAPDAGAGATTTPDAAQANDRVLQKAREEAQARQAVAKEAESRAAALAQRIEPVKKNIELEQRTLDAARKRAALLDESKAFLLESLQKKTAQGAQADVQDITGRLERLKGRQAEVQADIAASTDRINELQGTLASLQAEQTAALDEARSRESEAEAAQQKVASLENPFSVHQVKLWVYRHGPRILFIVLGFLAMHRLVKLSSHRIVGLMSFSGERGSHREREHRATTLVGVFRNTASMVVLAGGFLMLCDEVGIPVVPLMGGAAVMGLAVAFGAQNLIRDYFSGFMVLLEDQYAIDDVVQIGSVSGAVERITLRMTVLRDTEGIAHFIPHGTISTVSNMTHGWSRALFEVGVAYKEDVDRVMQVLLDLGRAMRQDEEFGPLILDDPEMLGVDSFDDSAVVVKFFIKTCPLKQWKVKREMLRRIKYTFDRQGIEIPFPHRTIYHRYENEEARPAAGEPGAGQRGAA